MDHCAGQVVLEEVIHHPDLVLPYRRLMAAARLGILFEGAISRLD